MQAAVVEIVESVHDRKLSCMLTFQFGPTDHLLTLHFRDGEVDHVAFGEHKGIECLALVREKKFSRYSLLEDKSVRSQARPIPWQGVLDRVRRIERVADCSTDTPFGHGIRIEPVASAVLAAIKERFIETAGPVAAFLFDQCLSDMGCANTAALSRGAVNLLVRKLCGELPEEDRTVFHHKCVFHSR